MDDYLSKYFMDGALVLLDWDIRKISDRRYEGTYMYTGKFCGDECESFSQKVDVYLSEGSCSMSVLDRSQ